MDDFMVTFFIFAITLSFIRYMVSLRSVQMELPNADVEIGGSHVSISTSAKSFCIVVYDGCKVSLVDLSNDEKLVTNFITIFNNGSDNDNDRDAVIVGVIIAKGFYREDPSEGNPMVGIIVDHRKDNVLVDVHQRGSMKLDNSLKGVLFSYVDFDGSSDRNSIQYGVK